MPSQIKTTIQGLFDWAFATPDEANLKQLWHAVEIVLQQMSEIEQLRLGGWAIARLADIHYQRAIR